MLNDTDFVFFQYCKSNWKLDRWTTKTYASWARNHMRTPSRPSKKPKHEILNDSTLLKMDDDSPSAPGEHMLPFPNTSFEMTSIPAEVQLATVLPEERFEILDPL
ncbi:hypothetical protein BDZ94DRAFT_595362 [Collybia nuda]|uniref:Uncharacterized protein n=1 Tax=Collybia nuda TaxID=64659 RepID=A0A9P5Y7L4_9AGAR|nr:hypothetical protein BDZ94DRAFT_595362 [Collybia nuda]